MKRAVVAAAIAFGLADSAAAQTAPAGAGSVAPTYQRQRVGVRYAPVYRRPYGGGAAYTAPRGSALRGQLRGGQLRGRQLPGGQLPRARQAAPQIGAGTFQRPYPYHLDYYKQRYGGGYDPYFGNLYGPPNVVLAPGIGVGLGQPITPGVGVAPGGDGLGPGGGAAGPVCPHCGQVWPNPLTQPPAQ